MYQIHIKRLVVVAFALAVCIVPSYAHAAPSRFVSNQTIFYDMLSRMAGVDAYNFEGRAQVRIPDLSSEASELGFSSDRIGVLFYGSQDRDKSTGSEHAALSLRFDNGVSETSLFPQFDTIHDGTDAYIKISNLAWVVNQFALLDEDVSSYENPRTNTPVNALQKYGLDSVDGQWIKIADNSFDGFFSSLGFDRELLDKVKLEQAESEKEMTARLQLVLKTAKKHGLFSFSRLPEEVMSGVDTYHLKVMVNKTRIRPFLIEVNNQEKKQDRMTLKEINELVKDVSKASLPTMEVWIGKDDFLPRKIVGGLVIKDSVALRSATAAELNISLVFSGFNNTSLITPPAKFLLVEDVINNFIQKIQEFDKQKMSVKDGGGDISAASLTPMKFLFAQALN